MLLGQLRKQWGQLQVFPHRTWVTQVLSGEQCTTFSCHLIKLPFTTGHLQLGWTIGINISSHSFRQPPKLHLRDQPFRPRRLLEPYSNPRPTVSESASASERFSAFQDHGLTRCTELFVPVIRCKSSAMSSLIRRYWLGRFPLKWVSSIARGEKKGHSWSVYPEPFTHPREAAWTHPGRSAWDGQEHGLSLVQAPEQFKR